MRPRTRQWLVRLVIGVSAFAAVCLGAAPAWAGGGAPPVCTACNYKTQTYKVSGLVEAGTPALGHTISLRHEHTRPR